MADITAPQPLLSSSSSLLRPRGFPLRFLNHLGETRSSYLLVLVPRSPPPATSTNYYPGVTVTVTNAFPFALSFTSLSPSTSYANYITYFGSIKRRQKSLPITPPPPISFILAFALPTTAYSDYPESIPIASLEKG